MARWEPNARERLERAALALFTEHGFDATTVAEIADRAGLTKSTFFRHFTDKREVVFTPERHDLAPQRRAVIAANSELQERELLKRARLASAMAEALGARGADQATARLAAEVGVLAFSTAYARWAAPDNLLSFAEIARATLHELQASAATLGVPES